MPIALGVRGASFAKGIALDDCVDKGLHAKLLIGRGLSDLFDDGTVIVFYSATEGVCHEFFDEAPQKFFFLFCDDGF
jgi:hypothetical protein